METLTFRQPRLVALALMVIIAGGLSALLSIGRQEDPTITNLFATITTVYPGAEPGQVEALVSAEIETVLREIPEVDTIESTSGTGISIVSIELLETLQADRIEQVWSEVRDALDDARATFPEGVAAPEFSSDGAGAFAATVALTATDDRLSLPLMARYSEDLADRLRSVPGTKLVEQFGVPEEEVLVSLDPAATAALGLSPLQIVQAVSAADARLPAGRYQGETSEFVLSVDGAFETLDRIKQIVVQRADDGSVTYLGDIADVIRGARSPASEAAYQDGKTAILVAARIEDGLQVDVWMGQARAEIAEFQAGLPGSIAAEIVFDQSGYTADRLSEVGLNLALGMVLVVGILLITLGLRPALIVAAVLPVVSLATLMTMNIIGLPIHQMSVTGLIVALGLLVDAAIVMTDDVGQRLSRGASRSVAVGQAVRRLFAPLLASTLTTALSFTPMILLPGPAGDFVGSIAIAVVVMLLWSFVIAVTITPAVAGWMLRPKETNAGRTGALGRAFRASLRASVRNPVRSISLSLVLPVMGFLAMPSLTQQFFPGVERDQFYIEAELAEGSSLEKTSALAEAIDRVLAEDDEINARSWIIGKSGPAFYYNIVSDRDGAPNFAQGLITTASQDATARLVPLLQSELSADFPQARVLVRDLVQGPPVNAPVELRLVGGDVETLRTLGEDLRAIVAQQPSITIARTSLPDGAPEMTLSLDEEAARLLQLDLNGVSGQLRAALDGVTGGALLEGTERLPVRVRYGADLNAQTQQIADIPLQSVSAQSRLGEGLLPVVPLSALADVSLTPGDSPITRRNGERTNTVQAFIQYGLLPEEALTQVREAIDVAGFNLPAGYRLEIGGDSDARSSTLNNLLASLGLIVTLSIATVVLAFGSFRLTAVTFVVAGLAAGLSILSLAVFQYPFGINAVIGVIGSIGVSINAAIVILSALKDDPRAASGDREAMAEIVQRSSRHIFSTTLTTFAGFLPLILGGGGFWPPFAMAVAGGVLLSSVVSLYFTPAMYVLVRRRPRDDIAESSNVTSMPLAAE